VACREGDVAEQAPASDFWEAPFPDDESAHYHRDRVPVYVRTTVSFSCNNLSRHRDEPCQSRLVPSLSDSPPQENIALLQRNRCKLEDS
jgi:hypothetical protein